jgi:hypothetical protein
LTAYLLSFSSSSVNNSAQLVQAFAQRKALGNPQIKSDTHCEGLGSTFCEPHFLQVSVLHFPSIKIPPAVQQLPPRQLEFFNAPTGPSRLPSEQNVAD